MRIPEAKIEQVRESFDIVDLVSEHVQLRKRGKNYIGLCPFHTEKTPSFTVSEEKQIYHCFGCHSGGNIFKFLMEYEKISFVEAVQELAERAGITLEYDSFESSVQQSETELLYDINTLAAKFFSDNLLNGDEGEQARKYFTDRKIKSPALRTFGLGYSPRQRDSLVNYLSAKKVDLEKAVSLGLILKTSEGRLTDRFSGRIMFPIFSPNGRVVAFAGRILEDTERAAKYVNSPESSIYIKGRVLYGLSFAKEEIRKLDRVILVEGYMDLISLYQAGIKNTAAVSGTALTEDQAVLLSRYSRNAYLIFDADTAGIKASMRSIEILLRQAIEVKIVTLPSGEDPDSFVNRYGREEFEKYIDKAENFLEYQTSFYRSQGMFDDAAKTAEAIRELVKPFALIRDDLKRNLFVKSIASKFNLREKLIESEIDKLLTRSRRTEQSREIRKKSAGTGEEIKRTNLALYNAEKDIIKLFFEGNREVIKLLLKYLKEEEFLLPVHNEIRDKAAEAYSSGFDITAASLLDKFEDENIREYIHKTAFDEYSISKSWEGRREEDPEKLLMKTTLDTIRNFLILKIDEKISQEHRALENAVSEEQQLKLIMQMNTLRAEKQRIREELG